MKGIPTLNQEIKRRTKLLQEMFGIIASMDPDMGKYYRARMVRLKIPIK